MINIVIYLYAKACNKDSIKIFVIVLPKLAHEKPGRIFSQSSLNEEQKWNKEMFVGRTNQKKRVT